MDGSELLINMGKRIAERRKYMNLSQEELSEIADVSPQMLSTAERGTKALRPENLLKISKAINVSTDYLLTGHINDFDEVKILEKIKKLTPEYLLIIERIIDNCIDLSKQSDCDKT